MNEPSPLAAAAARLRSRIHGVAGDGEGSDWLSQVEAGDWDDRFTPDAVAALSERLLVAAEHLRTTRAVAGEIQAGGGEQVALAQPQAGSGFRAAADDRLPLNRKERYYTGTVLPALIASDGLLHLPRFLRLCGLDVEAVENRAGQVNGTQDVQVFTEYSFAESILPDDRPRFAGAPLIGDAPDLVLTGPDWLLAVEAKVFHRPTVAALNQQMSRQAALVNYWARWLRLDAARVRHVLLLPEQLQRDRPSLVWPVVTWQRVRDAYAVAGDGYWLGVLRTALERYEQLASPEPTFGANADGRLTGDQIDALPTSETPEYGWVGRTGGLRGTAFAADRADGSWHTRSYEVRLAAPPPGSANWFTVAEFRAAVHERPPDAGAAGADRAAPEEASSRDGTRGQA